MNTRPRLGVSGKANLHAPYARSVAITARNPPLTVDSGIEMRLPLDFKRRSYQCYLDNTDDWDIASVAAIALDDIPGQADEP